MTGVVTALTHALSDPGNEKSTLAQQLSTEREFSTSPSPSAYRGRGAHFLNPLSPISDGDCARRSPAICAQLASASAPGNDPTGHRQRPRPGADADLPGVLYSISLEARPVMRLHANLRTPKPAADLHIAVTSA